MSKELRRVRSSSKKKKDTVSAVSKKKSSRQENTLDSSKKNLVLFYIVKKDGWAILTAIILLCISAWYFGFYTGSYTIETITVNDTEFINSTEVKNAVDEYIDSSYLSIIPRNYYWTASTDAITDTISSSFSHFAIEDITVEKKHKEIIITIVERIPSVHWTAASDLEKVYVVDKTGLITQQILREDIAVTEENKRALPLVTDYNRDNFESGWHIMSPEYVEFILTIQESMLQVTGLEPISYEFPETICQKREFVAEEIYQQELLNGASQEFYDKKIEIQQLFSDGLLTIDQSIDALEQIKNEELEAQGANTNGLEEFEWQVVYNDVECDYVKIASELDVITKSSDGRELRIKMDTTGDSNTQLENIRDIIQQRENVLDAEYLDVRIEDRVYYK